MAVRLVHYKASSGNVGDDFSEWLFSRYLGDALDPKGEDMLFGVGSILDQGFARSFGEGLTGRRLVFGSGARAADSVPDTTEGDWKIYCVRGPLSASAMDLPPSMGIADPAILAPLHLPAQNDPAGPVGIVPYFSASHEIWTQIAARLGWQLVSPHLGVEEFVAALCRCSRVFCESMHGAIFADAYRIPWRPVSGTGAKSEGRTHAFKWTDWTSSMGIGFDSIKIPDIGKSQSRGALARLKQQVKIKLITRALSQADQADRFLQPS